MDVMGAWSSFGEAVEFAVSRVVDDRDPLGEREAADGHLYVARVLRAVTESALTTLDPRQPAFMPMLESVRYLGAAGPDIDYDVAAVEPGVPHRITGHRGQASYVGIAVYGHQGERGASAIVANVDVDTLVDEDGSFVYELQHPEAARVIVRQYFHDRSTQGRGTWTIERLDSQPVAVPVNRPTEASMASRVAAAAMSLRWNAQLNQLWTPELRDSPNRFVRQAPEDIVAAVPNPDIVYATSWWSIGPEERLVIEFEPPVTRYWGLQLCDRWFQSYPERRSNLNDRQIVAEADGSVEIVVCDGDPGSPNWLDTSGHRVGVLFLRWLHAEPRSLPTCRVERAATR